MLFVTTKNENKITDFVTKKNFYFSLLRSPSLGKPARQICATLHICPHPPFSHSILLHHYPGLGITLADPRSLANFSKLTERLVKWRKNLAGSAQIALILSDVHTKVRFHVPAGGRL